MMQGLFIRSMETKQKLEIIYVSAENQLSQRIIRVLKVNEEKILAYCYSKRMVRTFTVSGILSAGAIRKRMGA